MQNKRQTGARYEKLAGAFLEENGLSPIDWQIENIAKES